MPWCSFFATSHVVSFVIVVVFFEKECERDNSVGLLRTECRHKQGAVEFCHLRESFCVFGHSI